MKKDELEITEKLEHDAYIFTLKGRLNTISADWFQFKLDEAFRDGKTNIILNMSQVQFLSSSGIRVILKTYKYSKEKEFKFSIECPSDCVVNVLGLVSMKELLINN
jgi:anti-anti-sigma factor